MTSKMEILLSAVAIAGEVMGNAAAASAQTTTRHNYRSYYYSSPRYSAPSVPNYDYSGRDPASVPYNYRGYADQGYAPPERGGQAGNF
jgi:hypothetical protein